MSKATIEVGQKAPNFTLNDQNGQAHALSDFLGKKVILYFYPKDNTPGCTTEACNFRDHHATLTDQNVVVIGVSKDSTASHLKFAEKYDLPFLLLSDPEHQVMETYGAWGEKKLYGKISVGTIRSTVLIDESGTVIKHYKAVKTKTHINDILKFLDKLQED